MFNTWTQEQQDAIQEFLSQCINNSYRCAHCMLKHEDNSCYFAYDCFLNDGKHWTDDED